MIRKEPFGRTGHLSSRVIFGSWALSQSTQKDADHVLELLLKYGVNHIDTAPMYGNAEMLVGNWMKERRDQFFLATKIRKRSYQEAWEGLQKSLERLHTDYVDLWQMHGLTNQAGWEKAMGEGGALQAMVEAREKGMVRFLGVTGHGSRAPAMHLQSLERFDFETVMLPYNYPQMQNVRYATDFNSLVVLCRLRKVAVQIIQTTAWRPWGKRPRTTNTYFYEPLSAPQAVEKAVHWAMGLPETFLPSVGDINFLPAMLHAAERFERAPEEDEMRRLVEEMGMKAVHP